MNITPQPFFIGLTRFSLYIPNSQSWNISRGKDQEEYKTALFSPERLDPRLDIFLNLSVPQLSEAAKEHNVKHFVQYSSALPAKYRQALEAAAECHEFLEVFQNDSGTQHSNLINDVASDIARSTGNSRFTYAWYRLDDDDLLSVDFFGALSKFVLEQNAGMVVSFGRGYTCFYYEGKLWDLRELYRPKTSVGQAYICSFDRASGTFVEPPRQDHAQIDKWAPTILDSRKPMFITMLHPFQDGHNRAVGAEALEQITAEQRRLPVAERSTTFQKAFPLVQTRGFGTSKVLVDATRTSSRQPMVISTQPWSHEIIVADGLISIDFEVTCQAPAGDSRVFIGLEFEASKVPDPQLNWQTYGRHTLVTGFPITKSVRSRCLFQVSPGRMPQRIVVWHSRTQESPCLLEFLSITEGS